MLQTLLQNFWNMVLILGCVALIICFVNFIIILITNLYDFFKARKIKDRALKELRDKLDSTLKAMDKESIDKEDKK